MSDESPEIRDIGPYQSLPQVMRQFANWSHGIPQPHVVGPAMLMQEAVMMTGAGLTDFENEYLITHGIDPIVATIFHGMLLRAYLAGQDAQKSPAPQGDPTPKQILQAAGYQPRPVESSDTSGQNHTQPPG